MINYTKEQLEAINFLDNNLLISASAGSGKTQVLLEKVIYLIEKGYDLNNILLVTFTNLASNEMKSKLENLLSSKFNETGDERFFDALKNINCANISTIHSFCQKLVKEYYYVLNIEPNFEIKEENYINILKNEALKQTFDYYFDSNDEDFIKLSNLFVYKRDYSLFKNEILSFYDFLISKPDKYNFIEKLISASYEENFDKNILINKYISFINKNLKYFVDKLKEIKLKAEQVNSIKLVELSSIIFNELNVEIKDFNDLIKKFSTKLELPDVRISKNAEIEEVLVKEELQSLKKQVKKFFDGVKDIILFDKESLKDDFLNSKKLLFKFVEIIKLFEQNFTTLKREENILDFNDLETLTLILLDNDEIKDEITNKFKFIFVDEYQDTNSIQEEILSKLSTNSKRIMVGDLKQSIYAFRECNPKIFNDKMLNYNLNEDLGKVVKLNKNFRSIEPILNFSNNVFSNLMQKENSNYNYKLDGMFVCGKQEKPILNNSFKPINIIAVNKKSEDVDFEENENILTVNTINNLLNQKIDDNGNIRNLTYKDIAIISRKRSEKIKNLCKFLDKFNIPYSVKYYEQIYKSFEINLIVAYLKLLNNFNDEISLVSVLKNIYNFNDNELLKIKKDNLIKDIGLYGNSDEIKEKIDIFNEDYHYFKTLVGEISVKELIKRIINKKSLDIILMKNSGKIVAEKLKIFIHSISDNLFSLFDFLSFVEKTKDCKFEILKNGGENSITIDTFHSTKGLEYNAVIIYSAGDKIFSTTKSNLIYNASLGIGIYKFNEEDKIKERDFIFNIIKVLNKQEEFNEEVRLSYVAFTRAKYFLTIIGTEDLTKMQKENNTIKFLDFNSYLSLVFSSDFKDENVEAIVLDTRSEIFEKTPDAVESHKEDKLDFSVFDNYFEKHYDYENTNLIQLKNSVTSLVEEDKTIYNISNFKVTDNDKEDFAMIGNCYHYALEKLPFNIESKQELHNKIINLIENKKLPTNILSVIDENKLLSAIKSMNKLVDDRDKIYKEKVFMLYLNYNDIFNNSNIKDKILIQGIIDLIIEKNDELILVDYKTSRLNDYNLIKKYALQLGLYEKALKNEFKNKKVKKYIYSIFLDKLINVV